MKKLILFSLLLVSSTGCASTAKTIAAMAKDPATSHLRVTTMWGSVEYSRTVPGTNKIEQVFQAPSPKFEFAP